MKKIISILSSLLIYISAFSQSPQKMSYQAVIRNANNNLISNSPVGMRISILQGSIFGASAYVETQNATTNLNGLVSISVGSGTIVTGNFSTINWANGPYFIKTETDPLGGTAYSISGITELMSVPYALHAGNVTTYTAGNGVSISNGIITNSSPNQTVNIAATGISSITGSYPNYTVNTPNHVAGLGIAVNGNTITNTAPNQTVNIAATGVSNIIGSYPNYTINTNNHIGGTGIAINGNTITNTAPNQTVNLTGAGSTSVSGAYPNYTISSPTYIAGNGITITSNTISVSNPSLTIGSNYAGGIVFYIDATGQHGLVCTTNDLGTNNWIPSSTWSNTSIASTFDCYLCGEVNSRIADNLFGGVSNAFQVCSNYSTSNYSDWYLPSRYELTLMYLNLKNLNLGNFSNGWYWSSTESGAQTAWVINFTNGNYASYSKWGSPSVIVRAIRAF